MTENQLKPLVQNWFATNGFHVTDIPREHGKRTPDLQLSQGTEKYLLEIKIKGDNEDELARDSAVLAAGHVLERYVPLSPRNTLDGIIEHGNRQMFDFDSALRSFHMLWIHCDGRDAHLLEERFRCTLFGQQRLISLERSEQIHAFYFRKSSFRRFRSSLDGVFLSYVDDAGLAVKLCINTLSPRVSAFRASALFTLHRNSLCDPELLERDGDAFVVDDTVDLTDESAVLSFLRSKYKLEHLQTFAVGAYSILAPPLPPAA